MLDLSLKELSAIAKLETLKTIIVFLKINY